MGRNGECSSDTILLKKLARKYSVGSDMRFIVNDKEIGILIPKRFNKLESRLGELAVENGVESQIYTKEFDDKCVSDYGASINVSRTPELDYVDILVGIYKELTKE